MNFDIQKAAGTIAAGLFLSEDKRQQRPARKPAILGTSAIGRPAQTNPNAWRR
jgi:hypothetical protein